MKYEEFKSQQDRLTAKRMASSAKAENKFYNDGLWNSVKRNPFKWWVFFVFSRG